MKDQEGLSTVQVKLSTVELISTLHAEIEELTNTLAALNAEGHVSKLGAQLDVSKAPKESLIAQIKAEEKRLLDEKGTSAALEERNRMIASATSLLQGKREQLDTLNQLLKQEQLEAAADSERAQIQALVEQFNSLSAQLNSVAIALWSVDRTAIKELNQTGDVLQGSPQRQWVEFEGKVTHFFKRHILS